MKILVTRRQLLSYVLIACPVVAMGAGRRQGVPTPPRPLPDSTIGRIGAADLRLLAPPALSEAAAFLSFDVKKYTAAKPILEAFLEKDPQSKFAYIALCQVDPEFRDGENYRLARARATSPDVRFRKCASSYLQNLAYTMYDRSRPSGADDTNAHLIALTDKESGALPQAERLWAEEKDMLNGILLSGIHMALGFRYPYPANFLFELIRASAGELPAEQYQKAKESGWHMPLPDVTGLGREKAGYLVAAVSNEVSHLSRGVPGKRPNEIADFNGAVKAVYSAQTKEWIYVQQGTELRFLGEWRRQLKHTYQL